jgi:hypothetical protein
MEAELKASENMALAIASKNRTTNEKRGLTNTVDHASCKPAAQDRITKL